MATKAKTKKTKKREFPTMTYGIWDMGRFEFNNDFQSFTFLPDGSEVAVYELVGTRKLKQAKIVLED